MLESNTRRSEHKTCIGEMKVQGIGKDLYGKEREDSFIYFSFFFFFKESQKRRLYPTCIEYIKFCSSNIMYIILVQYSIMYFTYILH